MILAADPIRFWAKVDKSGECWLWTAATSPDGYGRFGIRRKLFQAHRVSLALSGSTVPDGMVVDHVCRTRSCVKPDHLRIVDRLTNVHENSDAVAHLNSLKRSCPKGHPYSGHNLLMQRGRRLCRQCTNAKQRRQRLARKGESPVAKPCAQTKGQSHVR